MKRTLSMMGAIIILALLAACGPSPEQIAAMTASAWTPTPVPPTQTPVPTPIPIDLSVTMFDEAGAPIAGANVVFPESGNDEPVQSDEQGKFNWTNLAGEAATFKASAQGYFPAEQSATLKRGSNEVSIVLKRDPFGLIPSEACAVGEKLLYAEDFQDGKAQDWQNITAATDFAVKNGWMITPTADGDQSLVFSTITAIDTTDQLGKQLGNYVFDNAIWRLKARVTGKDGFSFLNWRQAPKPGGETRYPVQIGGGNLLVALTRLDFPDVGHFPVGNTKFQMKDDVWYFYEISAYNGMIQVWVDGEKLTEYQDPQPLPGGTISLEVHLNKDADLSFAYDNFSVCELSAPFTASLFTPATP